MIVYWGRGGGGGHLDACSCACGKGSLNAQVMQSLIMIVQYWSKLYFSLLTFSDTAMLDPSVAAPGTRPVEGVAPTWTDTQLQPLLGVTPLGPVQLSQEKVYQLKMLEGACKHLPQASDSEKVR